MEGVWTLESICNSLATSLRRLLVKKLYVLSMRKNGKAEMYATTKENRVEPYLSINQHQSA